MAFTHLGVGGFSQGPQPDIAAKTPADYPAQGILVYQFDTWQPGYANAIVNIVRAGTTDLCPVFLDINLSIPSTNPQVLMVLEDDLGNSYGKFRYSLYTPYSYELDIENIQQTGIQQVPLVTLDGEDASLAEVTVPNSERARKLQDRFADVIRLVDIGEVVDNTDTNTTNLNSAIAIASAQGGGIVRLPAGTIKINVITIPAKVVLQGEGKYVTILESVLGDEVITLGGDACGLMDLTLDGVNLVGGSTGIYSKAKDDILFENVLVHRFRTGVTFLGGIDPVWRNFDVINCTDCIRTIGDQDANGGNDGDEISGIDYYGGVISQSTGVGLELSVRDRGVSHSSIRKVDFIDNVGTDGALLLYGASFTDLDEVYFSGNTTNLTLGDNPDDTLEDIHQVISFHVTNSRVIGGTIVLDGKCQDVSFERCQFEEVTFEANVPENPVMLRDCTEFDTTITGDGTKINRFRSNQEGTVSGSTTSATPVIAYKTTLSPNEVIQLQVNATAERINGSDYADFLTILPFRCAPATLLFDEQTANFTVGNEIVGATSGARGIIVAQSDAGTTGSLSLGSVSGEFIDNELITEVSGSGSARTNGTLTLGTVTAGAKNELHAGGSNSDSPPSGWAIDPVASGQEAQVQLTGAASNTIDWDVKVSITRL